MREQLVNKRERKFSESERAKENLFACVCKSHEKLKLQLESFLHNLRYTNGIVVKLIASQIVIFLRLIFSSSSYACTQSSI